MDAVTRQYLVQYGGSGDVVNRLIKVDSKAEVLAASLAAFSLVGNFAIEVYNVEYDLYVRVDHDNIDNIPDGGKLRLVRLPVVEETLSTPSQLSTAETVPVLSMDFSGLPTKSQGNYILPVTRPCSP